MFDVIDDEGNAQHPLCEKLEDAVQSCDALNALNRKKPDGSPRRFFVEQRFIRHPKEFATVVQAAAKA